MGRRFADANTPQEATCGDLGGGLFAIKVMADDGAVEYMICDRTLRPLYAPAKTLDELRTRFPWSR